MLKKSIFYAAFCISLLAILWAAFPVSANPDRPQVFFSTPTPDSNGRIVYVVQAEDTCTRISILMGVSIDDIRLLNDMPEGECQLQEGQELLLAVVEPSTPEPLEVAPTPTPSSLEPTPTYFPGNAEICVFLFDDVNGNAMAEETELPLAGGAISITDQNRSVSLAGETQGAVEPVCFSEIPEGDYNISIGIPEGYNPTTIVNYPISVKAGEQVIVDFGAQVRINAAAALENLPAEEVSGGRTMSPLLAVIGLGLVLVGVGLGIYVKQM